MSTIPPQVHRRTPDAPHSLHELRRFDVDSGHAWMATCVCGWSSGPVETEEDGRQAYAHHIETLRLATREALADI